MSINLNKLRTRSTQKMGTKKKYPSIIFCSSGVPLPFGLYPQCSVYTRSGYTRSVQFILAVVIPAVFSLYSQCSVYTRSGYTRSVQFIPAVFSLYPQWLCWVGLCPNCANIKVKRGTQLANNSICRWCNSDDTCAGLTHDDTCAGRVWATCTPWRQTMWRCGLPMSRPRQRCMPPPSPQSRRRRPTAWRAPRRGASAPPATAPLYTPALGPPTQVRTMFVFLSTK
jgi:hypothetical protein